MLQIIEEPTREENTLDLMFTNETGMVTMIEVNKSKNSDHDIVEISTNYSWLKFWVPKTILDQPYDYCHGEPAVILWGATDVHLVRVFFLRLSHSEEN